MSGPPPLTFHLFTGEYPPRHGGVSDYSAQVAGGLASAGCSVHVWTSPDGDSPGVPGVTVHRDAGHWSAADLARVGAALDGFPAPRRLLVQYTPNAWGYKGLNLRFCRWLVGRRRLGDEVRMMFHEVAYPWQIRDFPTRWLLSAGHRWMAHTLMKAGTRIDVTTPAWGRMLHAYAPGEHREIGWLPVPSNIPVVTDAVAVASVRRRVSPLGGPVLGSFSTFSDLTGPLLASALPDLLLARPDRVGLLIGQGGDRLAARLLAAHPLLNGRLTATGCMTSVEISTHLQACDLMIQLYPDGLTTRRGSLMAGLAHGIPTVSNVGHLTEPFWAGSAAVALAAGGGVFDVAPVVEHLLTDTGDRQQLGSAGRVLYARRFALERTVEAIVGQSLGVAS